MQSIGSRRWAIAEGYIPLSSSGDSRELTSHETACILNAGDEDALVRITVFSTDRKPAGSYRLQVSAAHQCDVPLVVRHTRLDSRQAALALLTTITCAEQ